MLKIIFKRVYDNKIFRLIAGLLENRWRDNTYPTPQPETHPVFFYQKQSKSKFLEMRSFQGEFLRLCKSFTHS